MQFIRAIILILGFCFLLSGVSLMWGVWAPWYTSFLIGSTLFAYAIATLWIGVIQSYHALVGGGLSLALTFGAIAIYSLQKGAGWYGQVFLYLAIIALWIFFFGLTLPKKMEEKLPLSVKWLLGTLATFALLEGIYLIIPQPFRFAWMLRQEQAIVYGWMLIGGSLFFGWVMLKPTWENGYPALYALLVYDILLVGPVIHLFFDTALVVVPFYLWSMLIILLGSGIWGAVCLLQRLFRR